MYKIRNTQKIIVSILFAVALFAGVLLFVQIKNLTSNTPAETLYADSGSKMTKDLFWLYDGELVNNVQWQHMPTVEPGNPLPSGTKRISYTIEGIDANIKSMQAAFVDAVDNGYADILIELINHDEDIRADLVNGVERYYYLVPHDENITPVLQNGDAKLRIKKGLVTVGN